MNELFLIGASALLVAAAVCDVRSYRIPNVLCGGLALLFAVRAVALGAPYPLMHLPVAALVFVVCMVLFCRGLMGGGDVKLLAAAVLWIPPALVPAQILAVSVAGALIAVLLLLVRRTARTGILAGAGGGTPHAAFQDDAPVPYGVAIAIGTIAYLPLS